MTLSEVYNQYKESTTSINVYTYRILQHNSK